jgi:gliding motility-associated-like protein
MKHSQSRLYAANLPVVLKSIVFVVCVLFLMVWAPGGLSAQAPTLSYSTPKSYTAGTAITPLVPTSSGVASLSYSAPMPKGSGFSQPNDVAVDNAGNIYVADQVSSSVKKIPAGGGAPVSIASGFTTPSAIAVDPSGNVYVADRGAYVIKKILASNGSVVTINNVGFPYGIAVDAAENIYYTDQNSETVRKIPAGSTSSVNLCSQVFKGLFGIEVGGNGNVYFIDQQQDTYSIYKVLATGGAAVKITPSGLPGGIGITVDLAGNVYSSSYDNTIRMFPAGGGSMVSISTLTSDPEGLTFDSMGNLFVATIIDGTVSELKPTGGYFLNTPLPVGLNFDYNTGTINGTPTAAGPSTNYTVVAYNATGSASATINITVALPPPAPLPVISYNGGSQHYTAGTAITPLTPTSSGVAARSYSTPVIKSSAINKPTGLAMDKAGNIYVSDLSGPVKKIPAGGGAPVALGTFSAPTGVAVDPSGNVYVADRGSSSIKKILASDGSIITYKNLGLPYGIAVDATGNIYYTDQGTHSVKEIPSISNTPITLTSISNSVTGIAVDGSSNVYFCDLSGQSIYKIPAGGGTPVKVNSQSIVGLAGLTLDASGNIYTSSTDNTVRMFPANGGSGVLVGSGYGSPVGLAVDANQHVFVADQGYNAIKESQSTGGYFVNPALPSGLAFDSNTGTISGTPLAASPSANFTVTAYNATGGTSATVNITVATAPISLLTYNGGPQQYMVNLPIAPLVPTSKGVATASYSTPVTKSSGFNDPTGVAVDASGNIYVADYMNSLVKKIPATGGATVIIGSGFNKPTGVAVDASGNIYVADRGNNAIKKILASNGSIVAFNGIGSPYGVAADAAGNIYYTDQANLTVRKIPAGGGSPQTFSASYNGLTGITVDDNGNVYFSDSNSQAIYKIPAGGGTAVKVNLQPIIQEVGLAVDGSGNVYVSSTADNSVRVYPANGGDNVQVGAGYNNPAGLAVDAAGNVFVADGGNNAVKKVQPTGNYFISPMLPSGLSFDSNTGTISGTPLVARASTNYTVTAYNVAGGASTTVNITVVPAAVPTISYSGGAQHYTANSAITPLTPTSNGVGAQSYSAAVSKGSGFNNPMGVAVDNAGNIYVADYANSLVKKIPVGGGAPVNIGSGFNSPTGVAVDASGNVYVADQGNGAIKKILVSDGSIVAFNNLGTPYGIAVDAAGNVFFTEQTSKTVKEILAGSSSPIIISTGITDNNFYYHIFTGIAVDGNGSVYFNDADGNAVYKIPANGNGSRVKIISHPISKAAGLAVDASGNVYISFGSDNTVRMFPANGGNSVQIGSGYNNPAGLAVDAAGNLFVADAGNNAIKELQPTGNYFISPMLPAGLSFDSYTGTISGTPLAANPSTNYTVTAYNPTGGGTATVNISVAPVPLPTISYTGGSQHYTVNAAITPLAPTSTGVVARSYSAPVIKGSGFNNPTGVTVDKAGNIYVADYANSLVKKIPVGGGTPVVLGSGFNKPTGVAVDKAGNIYVADWGNGAIKKILASDGSIVAINNVGKPYGIAVDAVGNIYYTDQASQSVRRIPADGGPALKISVNIFGSGTYYTLLTGIAVDGNDNVYFNDSGDSGIFKIPASGGIPEKIGNEFIGGGVGVAVDSCGNIYATYNSNNTVRMIPAEGGTSILVAAGYNSPTGIAVDSKGNLFVADGGNNLIKELQPTGNYFISPMLPSGLSFNSNNGTISGTPLVSSPSTNYTVTAYNPSGSASTVINITVDQIPLPVISYSGGSQYYTVNTSISPLSPTSTGVTKSGYFPVALASGLNAPAGVAVDNTGNVYFGSTGSAPVMKIPAGGGAPVSISPAINNSSGLAVDASGNVFVAEPNDAQVAKIPAGGGAPVKFASYTSPIAVAIKTNDISVLDATNGYYVLTTPNNGGIIPLIHPTGLAVVRSNVTYYASDPGARAVLLFGPGKALEGAWLGYNLDLSQVTGVAVDVTGNVYTTNTGGAIYMIPANGHPAKLLVTDFTSGYGLALDGAGNIYAAQNQTPGRIVKFQLCSYSISPALPPGLTFDNTTGIISGTPTTTSALTAYTITAYNEAGKTSTIVNIAVDDHSLSNLTISAGALTPTFASNALNYTANVTNAVSSIQLTPTATDASAIIKVNGTAVASGSASAAIPLHTNANTIKVAVSSVDGGSAQTYTIVVNRAKADQTITFNPLASVYYGTADFDPGATVTSGSIITYTSSNPAVATIVNGKIHLTGAGTSTITASVDSNSNYNAAVPVAQLLRVNDLSLSNLAISTGALTPSFASTTLSYTVNVPNTVSSIQVTPAAPDATVIVKVNNVVVTSGSASGTIPLHTNANTIKVTVSLAGGGPTQTYTIVVNRAKADQTITFNALANVDYSTADFAPGATVTSGAAIAYTSSNPAVATIINGKIHVTGTGTSTITASVDSNSNYNAAIPVARLLTVNKANQTINAPVITVLTKGGQFDLSVFTASSGLPVTITTSDATIAFINGQTLKALAIGTATITISQPGDANYLAATAVTRIVTVIDGLGDDIVVHQALSPNGDGINEQLYIEGIKNYPDNSVTIVDRNGNNVFHVKNYDNSSRVFDGHSNSGSLQQAGSYFYLVEYTDKGEKKRKTGYFILKY